jgi:two-component system sensor histidine kinase KdpD
LRNAGIVCAVVGASAAVCAVLAPHVEPTNLAMVFLLGVAFVASRVGAMEAFFASLLSVLIFDLAFVPPRGRLAVSDTQYLITFVVMTTVSLLISRLTSRLREEVLAADEREQHTAELYARSQALAKERAALAKMTHEAKLETEAERARSALLSSISHDLRTPLTSISGAAGLLVERGGGELAETIQQETRRLNQQVQNLLDLTRLENGVVQPRLEWQSLEEIVGTALARSKELLRERPVTARIPVDLPLLRLDGELVEKVFVNVLQNVASHTPEGTPVVVEARRLADSVGVLIADRGPGIPAGQEEEIFERFARAGSGAEGVGLGLAICRTVMRLHGGRVWAQPRPGGGSEFYLDFPLPQEQPEVPVG